MVKKDIQGLYVIFDRSRQRGGPGTRYIAKDGTSTERRTLAARFLTFSEAERFAHAQGIPLDATRQIAQEMFTEWDDLAPRK